MGYALIPYATAYHYNDIGLSPESLGAGYDIDGNVIKVAPTRGLSVKLFSMYVKGIIFSFTSVSKKNQLNLEQ